MDNPHAEHLRAVVAKAPLAPGVYRWRNDKGETLYVGKAKLLRNRLRSYVAEGKKSGLGPWKLALVSKVADVDWTVTNTELEALILETNMIKEERPKYNVMMKDDKNYVYVRISLNEAFPSVTVTRYMQNDKAKYFGPYLKKYEIDRVLELLHEIFPYRTSKQMLDTLNRRARDGEDVDAPVRPQPSWEAQIGKHCGVGFGEYKQADYRHAIDSIVRFFKGDHGEAKSALREGMQLAAEERKFERAAKLRDGLAYIEALAERQIASNTSGENIDAIGVALQSDTVQMVVLQERGGKIVGELSFALAGRADSPAEALEQFLPQYYTGATDIPDAVVISELIEDTGLMAEWLTERRGKKVTLSVPERGKRSRLLDMARQNAEVKVSQQMAKWEAAKRDVEDALTELQRVLELPAPPKRIEGYDISHLGGTETVGSMVVMRSGKAANAEYRSFTIRTLKAGQVDDYAALREVLRRRLLYLVRNIRQEETVWKERGITIGKPRKKELELSETWGGPPSAEAVSFECMCMLRKDDAPIGAVALRCHDEKKIMELTHFAPKDARLDAALLHFAERKLLAGVKKGKVYVCADPAHENEYASFGFRHLHQVPPALESLVDECHTVLLWEAVHNKTDASLAAAPDLLVIDGGKGQLGAVLEVLRLLNLDIPVIGLAKREEDVFRPRDPAPLPFKKDSPGRFLLMRLRDEAHRFANRHRERRLATKAVLSVLDGVPGIGDKTRQALLRAFGDVPGIRAASDEALLTIVNRKQLDALRAELSVGTDLS